MSQPRKVLIIDDEPHIRRLIRTTLTRAGYDVVEAENAREAMESLRRDKPDVVLLDLGLPDRDGLELVPLIKQQSTATLLVVSAREATEQKVTALDLGADDYVTKPFDTDELLARVRTGLRRQVRSEAAAAVVRAGDVEIDLINRQVRRRGVEIHVTAKEFGFLAELAKHPGRVITHPYLLKTVWGSSLEHHVEYVRVVVRNLRQKIEDDPARPVLVVNELGVGYRLKASET
ncbi:MAG: response regulator transcription factor [Sphingomonadaceae bacterium]|nr:response regulator transcription factor [Sphingomonadaceae bacterium]